MNPGMLAISLMVAATAQAERQREVHRPSNDIAVQLTIDQAALQQWLGVERDRLNLDQKRFQLEQTTLEGQGTKKASFWSTPGGSASIGAFVTGMFGLLVLAFNSRAAYRTRVEDRERGDQARRDEREKVDQARREERDKMREEVMLARSGELTANRMRQYRKLWARLNRLSMYPLPRGLKSEDLSQIHDRLREWYFELGGGMFLSLDRDQAPGSQTRYFALQAALGKVRDGLQKSTPDDVTLVTENDSLTRAEAKADEDEYDGFRADSALPPLDGNFAHFRFLRALGSRLRSSIVEDLGTRAIPVTLRESLAPSTIVTGDSAVKH